MLTLFVLALVVDCLLLFGVGYEAFMVSSNKNRLYRQRFFLLLAVVLAAIVRSFSHLKQAVWLAAVPAVGIILFALVLIIIMLTRKGRWN